MFILRDSANFAAFVKYPCKYAMFFIARGNKGELRYVRMPELLGKSEI